MNHFSKFSVLQKMPFVIRTFASKSFLRGGGRKEVAKIDDRVFQNMTAILRTFAKKSCQKGGEGDNKSGGSCKSGGAKSGCGGKDGKCSGDQPKDSSAGSPKAKKSNENKSCRRGPSMSHFEAAKWRRISLYVLPAVFVFTIFTFATMHKHERPEFVPYAHLRKRDKKFFWGDGNHTFFHNKHVNALPEGYEED